MTSLLFPDLAEARDSGAGRLAPDWRPGVAGADWPWGDLAPGAYDVIVADPPWNFGLWSQRGEGKSAQAHYACQGLDWIKALPVRLLARPNALLLLWGIWPMLATGDVIDVARAWGFVPVSGGSWAKRYRSGKLRWGTGYVIRSTAEPFLIAVDETSAPFLVARIGEPDGCPSLSCHVDGLAREHSRKPDEFYSALVKATPGRRRCDLFNREPRAGFDVWGDETGKFG